MEVDALAIDTLRDHLLNFSISDAELWGQQYWASQPSDALLSAAQTDSADLLLAGSLQRLSSANIWWHTIEYPPSVSWQ